jgi:predicted flap endonuclease-1-like 5' DNA nuclease
LTFTPIEWKDNGKLRNWVRDRNKNFVDDRIERQSGQVDIIVDLNQCVGDPSKSNIVQYLNTVGDVIYVGKYLSCVIVVGVQVKDCFNVASRPEVAMVELAPQFKWLSPNDNYRAAKIQKSTLYQSLEDDFGWPGTLNGNGINIAFLDSGVDATYDTYYKYGYDAYLKQEINPSPDNPHATGMASFVFGKGAVAPQAGLVDIKVCHPDGKAYADTLMEGLDKVIEKHWDWGINIATIMTGWAGTENLPADGKDAISQLVNLVSSKGVIVVVSASDNVADSEINMPACADSAFAVAAADIKDTVDRSDDVATFAMGPRAGPISLEALKPELVIPTNETFVEAGVKKQTGYSSSIAAAIASGLGALILQNRADLRSFDNKAVSSLKDLLIRTAEIRGAPDPNNTLSYPKSTPTWNKYWGFGYLDAYKAFQHLTGQIQTGRTDLTFKGFDDSDHPSDPWYYSHAIETQSERQGKNIVGGVADKIYARIRSKGSSEVASNVLVNFGFYAFSAGINRFYDIGSVIVPTIQANSDLEVSMDWTPPVLPKGQEHGCIQVTIVYGFDSDFSNMSNFAQKNVQVKYTSSPALFKFQVENTLPSAARIDLAVDTVHRNWSIQLSETSFVMSDYDCAHVVHAAIAPPSEGTVEKEALFFITAYATARGSEQKVEIGGVALKVRLRRGRRGVSLERIEGIGKSYAERLAEAGVINTNALLEAGATGKGRKALAEKTGIAERLLLEWVNRAGLMRIHGVGEEYSDILALAGVDSVMELSQRTPSNLFAKLREVNNVKRVVQRLPGLANIRSWILQAKTLSQKAAI